MSIVSEPGVSQDFAALAKLTEQLPESDGVPMDSPWHRANMTLLIQSSNYHRRGRDDYYVGGNMFIYYGMDGPKPLSVGPDFFYVSGVERRRPRRKWVVWDEHGKFPDLIVEFQSPTTATIDLTTKKTLYEQVFRTREYFCFDPEADDLKGWRLAGKRYRKVKADGRGWMWSEELNLWLGTWAGEFEGQEATWLRLFDQDGQMIPVDAELAAAADKRAEAASKQAEAVSKQVEAAIQRAHAAEQENALLKARLEELEKGRRPRE